MQSPSGTPGAAGVPSAQAARAFRRGPAAGVRDAGSCNAGCSGHPNRFDAPAVSDAPFPDVADAPERAVRTAYARHHDAATAAERCVALLGAIQPVLLLVFCGGKHDPAAVLGTLLSAYGPVPVVGGSAAGAIGCGQFGCSGLELGVVAFRASDVVPRVHVTRDLLAGERQAGFALARDVAAGAAEKAVVLLFFDNVASVAPLRLHHASAIMEGFQAGLGGKRLTVIGGGLLTDMNLSDSWVFDGGAVVKHAAIALVFPPAVRAETTVLHGCRPVSTFMEITSIEGAVVYELDGRPALAVVEEMLGLQLVGDGGADLSLVATLGEKQGDPFAPYNESAYVNRLILSADRATGSITLFEPDFHLGAKVQIMARDNALMLDSVRRGTAAARERQASFRPFLTLYVDCAGRASAWSGAQTEEAELVLRNLDPAMPMLGFYSGVEIAPFDGYSRPLDWTGVLAMLGRQT